MAAVRSQGTNVCVFNHGDIKSETICSWITVGFCMICFSFLLVPCLRIEDPYVESTEYILNAVRT